MSQAATNSFEHRELVLTPLATGRMKRPTARILWNSAVLSAALFIVGLLVWQALTSHGNPDPTVNGLSPAAAVLDTGILVFREGLEAILVLAALTASLVRTEEGYWRPVALGASVSFLATVATWFIVVAIISGINALRLTCRRERACSPSSCCWSS